MSARLPHEVDLDLAPRLREHVVLIPVADEAILFEEGVGTLHRCNPTASAVCSLFDGRATLRELAVDISAVFSVEPTVVEQDLLVLVRDLAVKGVLADVEPEGEGS